MIGTGSNFRGWNFSENIIAGPAMQRRATFQFGTPLPKGPNGQVNAGIGPHG